MSTGYERRYAGLSRAGCHDEALRLCGMVTSGGMKWEELPERLLELRKVGSYAEVPAQKNSPPKSKAFMMIER